MKLPNWMPKLSRKQKTARNLLIALVLLLLGWWVNDFRAPTPGLALRWKAEEYALPAPELLYRAEKENNSRDIVFRAGEFYGVSGEYRHGWLSYRLSDVYLTKAGDGTALLPEMDSFRGDELYAYTEYPGAVQADCEIRMRHDITVNGIHFDWDETYVMEAQPNEKGLYRFEIQKKYGDGNGSSAREMAEESVIRRLFDAFEYGYSATDSRYDITITFYDTQGREVHTYEKTLEHTRPA